jgi:hypothetical protein
MEATKWINQNQTKKREIKAVGFSKTEIEKIHPSLF